MIFFRSSLVEFWTVRSSPRGLHHPRSLASPLSFPPSGLHYPPCDRATAFVRAQSKTHDVSKNACEEDERTEYRGCKGELRRTRRSIELLWSHRKTRERRKYRRWRFEEDKKVWSNTWSSTILICFFYFLPFLQTHQRLPSDGSSAPIIRHVNRRLIWYTMRR